MSRPLLLLRPQPGNDRSAERARALGIEVLQLPLFETVAVEPDELLEGPFDAILITSANGARFGADLFARHAGLPVFAVGEASAQAAREAGAHDVRTGGGDAASTIPMIAAAGHRAVLHICGEDARSFDPQGLGVTRHIVYRSDALDMRRHAKALATLPPSVIAIHSPGAGRRLNALIPPPFRNHILIAISDAAAHAAGGGWRRVQVAETPDDTALLRLASTLCMAAS
ncbi:uroporphyrinogen-III synthase [Sphingobium nicotianae]|uniref:Uroporphyrinogen-III synthase n=1 Tax=Sphingobium nicotianae TaxID=2782607 RepID=A0A9X1IPQ2_9SPHN|nr:uroporphyrinogen-III synthase [Sphingobium nicotianae]MBT2186268.1 uroporphyrinogen-III synthase [Sphingobium nicotianae]